MFDCAVWRNRVTTTGRSGCVASGDLSFVFLLIGIPTNSYYGNIFGGKNTINVAACQHAVLLILRRLVRCNLVALN